MVRSKIAAIGASLALGVSGVALSAIPAHAAETLEICNSSNSRGNMVVSSSIHQSGVILYRGSCNTFWNGDDSVRVDPEAPGSPDVDSTWWGFEGKGLDYCINGEGWINPPNYYIGYVKYNSDASGC